MTAEEIQAHPEFPHVHWKLKPDKKGTVGVAAGRGGPFKISYELHGNGPRKIVVSAYTSMDSLSHTCLIEVFSQWIMGLGGLKQTWQRQTKDFGHAESDKYTCLIFDNRGIGESDKPLLRYTTSEMAKDVVELLDHVGWTEERSVHVVGISMGGMIAQELGLRAAQRICSLNLISTAPRIVRTLPYLENIANRVNMLWPKPLDAQIAKVKTDCYSSEWLAQPDESEFEVQPFPTNADRFGAGEIKKRLSPDAFPRTGFICQLHAAGFHHKSAKELKQLGDLVGRERILVLHGRLDNMIQFTPHAEMLLRELGGEEGGVTSSFHTGIGHVMPVERRKDFKDIIVARIDKTESM